MMTVCPICGTRRVITWPEHWVYRRGETYYCSENCMMVDQTRDMKLIHMIAHVRALKGSRSKMKQIISYEQKKQAAMIAIDGGNPLEYLAKLGSSSPVKMWGHIRALMKEKEPEIYAKLPDLREVKPKEEAQIPYVKVNGPLKIETPEANKIEIVETPEDPPTRVIKRIGGKYEVSAIRVQNMGEFYYDIKYNTIDWRTDAGDEVSLSPIGWKNLAEELPDILAALGAKV